MSNTVRRPPLRGVIIRGERIVGGVELPDPPEAFLDDFNRNYHAIGLRVEQLDQHQAPAQLDPAQQHRSEPVA